MKTFSLEQVSEMTSGDVEINLGELFSAVVLGETMRSSTIYKEVGPAIIQKSEGKCECLVDENGRFAQLRLKFPEVEGIITRCKLVFSVEGMFEVSLDCFDLSANVCIPILINLNQEKIKDGYFYQELKAGDYFVTSYTSRRSEQDSYFIVRMNSSLQERKIDLHETSNPLLRWMKRTVKTYFL